MTRGAMRKVGWVWKRILHRLQLFRCRGSTTKKQFITIPQAVAALANMERELDSAESYAQIRKLADAAEALKILFRHVAEVKNKAELVVLAANQRIGEEISRHTEGNCAAPTSG